jgi:hypothetical protein
MRRSGRAWAKSISPHHAARRSKIKMATKKNGSGPKAAGVEKERRLCAVKLSEQERATRGDEMADCEVAIEKLKGERSELARQVKTHEKRRNELGHALDTGAEQRELLCAWEPDFAKNVFRLMRPDTQEEIDTRPMTASDRTADLFPPTNGALPPPPRSPKRGRPPKSASTESGPRSAA